MYRQKRGLCALGLVLIAYHTLYLTRVARGVDGDKDG
jgi:hypothetical protein